MQVSPSPRFAASTATVTPDCAAPSVLGTTVERLALTLLNLAERFEVEPGVELLITPSVTLDELAALAGGTSHTAGLLLAHWLEEGIVAWRRQRLLLWNAPTLYQLALGSSPSA
jgi:CRP-like cAMP-binding protein